MAWPVGKQAAGSLFPMCQAKNSTGFRITFRAATEMIQHSSGIFLPNKTNAAAIRILELGNTHRKWLSGDTASFSLSLWFTNSTFVKCVFA